MRDLQNLEVSELVDLLANETGRYYKMIKEKVNKSDHVQCKMIIEKIQKETALELLVNYNQWKNEKLQYQSAKHFKSYQHPKTEDT